MIITKRSLKLAALVTSLGLAVLVPRASALSISLGSAADFAILAGSGITDAGGSSITGNIGLSPTTGAAVTGLLAGQVGGTIYVVDASGPGGSVNNPGLLTIAKNDLTIAYNVAAAAPTTGTILGNQLGGLTLSAGVYNFEISTDPANLTGTLTLSGSGLFVFQVGADLQTAIGSSVEFINGATACNVIWQVGSSANLLGSDFDGTILALTSITLGDDVTVNGRLLARNGNVTLINDNIILDDNCQPGDDGGTSVPDAGSSLLLLGFGLAGLIVCGTIFRESPLQARC